MQKHFFILLILFLISCTENQKNGKADAGAESTTEGTNNVIFSGEITDLPNSPVELSVYLPDFDTSFQITNDSVFSFQLPFSHKQYFRFQVANEYGTIFAEPNDSVYFTTSYPRFDEELTFSADKANENNYLVKNYMTRREFRKQKKELYKNDFTSFEQAMEEYRENLAGLLESYQENGLDKKFYEKEKRRNSLEYYKKIIHYPSAYQYFNKEDATINENFYTRINQLSTDDEGYLAFDYYIDVLLEKLKLQKPAINRDQEDYVDQLLERISNIENKKIQEHLLFEVALEKTKFGRDNKEVAELQKQFLNTSTNDSLKEELKEYIAKREEISAGHPAQEFTMVNRNKQTRTLSDYRGNLVYIDFWATWCKPCRKEIPHFNKLDSIYANDEISFLSISLNKGDDAFEEWLEFQEDHPISGEVFIALEDHKKVVHSYHIYRIPRYVLIDRNGRIITPNAPYPSETEELGEILEKHL